MELLADLQRGRKDFSFGEGCLPASIYGLGPDGFRDLVIHLVTEGYVNGFSATDESIAKAYLSTGSDFMQSLVAHHLSKVFERKVLSVQLDHKGRLRLWALKAELEGERQVDLLTGLYTRAAFAPDYEIAWAFLPDGGAVTVMEVDLDEFGSINNAYDHSIGDEALRRFANTLRDSVGKLGSCYRFGGDEFVVLLPAMTAETASKLAESIRGNVERAFQEMQGIEKVPKRPTASIGVAVFTGKVDPQTAYQYADGLEREAKKVKNRVQVKLFCLDGPPCDRVERDRS